LLSGLGTAGQGLEIGAGVVEGVLSTSTLGTGKEADVGRLDLGKYLSSKSALSEMMVFFVVGEDALLHVRT